MYHIFSKLFASVLILLTTYVASVFVFPDLADRYGDIEINTQIRSLKSKLDTFGSWGLQSTSLIENAQNIAKPYIDETKNTAAQIQKTLLEKTEQAQKAANSIEKAYTAVESAKNDVKTIINANSGTIK